MTSRKKNPANSSPIALKRSSIEILSRFLANCKKSFPSAQVLISSEIYKKFCKIPHLAITGHAPLPRFDRILKSVLKQFKKKSKKYKTFALHPNLCPSNHKNQQTWNNANLLKKSSQNGLSSMKVHGFQAKWPNL